MPVRLELIVDEGVAFQPHEELEDLLAFAAERETQAPSGDWEMVVRLTDDDEITRLHERFFDDATPTDIISFPSGEDLGQPAGSLGDVVISVDTAALHAADAGHSTAREVAFLMLHGLLHLCGYDDRTPDDRRRMLHLQQAYLELFEKSRPCRW